MTKSEEEFLRESNAIENVFDYESLKHAAVAWNYIKKQPQLSTSNIKRLHRLLMRDKLAGQELGHFRQVAVSVGLEAKGPPFELLQMMVKEWSCEANILGKSILQIMYHHVKYEFIHPFIDGNGRTGRMLMNWEFIRNGYPIKIFYARDRQMYYQMFKPRKSKEQVKKLNEYLGVEFFRI